MFVDTAVVDIVANVVFDVVVVFNVLLNDDDVVIVVVVGYVFVNVVKFGKISKSKSSVSSSKNI